MKRITITVDESILEQLKAASEESMRPIATEALYRMKLGLSRELAVSVQDKVVGVSAEGFIKDKEKGEEFAGEVPGLDPEDEYEIRERVVVKPKEKLDKLVKDGVVRKGVKELPSQGDGEFKTYFKEKKDGKQK